MLGVRWCQGRQQVGVWTRWWGVRVRWCQGRQQVGVWTRWWGVRGKMVSGQATGRGVDEVVGC